METYWITPFGQFELVFWGISSGSPLVIHLDLPGPKAVFDISQETYMCV